MDERKTIDVTGLPEPVIAGLRGLVAGLRAALPGSIPPGSQPGPGGLPYDEWKKRFDEWVNRPCPPGPGPVDDSRESVYEGR